MNGHGITLHRKNTKKPPLDSLSRIRHYYTFVAGDFVNIVHGARTHTTWLQAQTSDCGTKKTCNGMRWSTGAHCGNEISCGSSLARGLRSCFSVLFSRVVVWASWQIVTCRRADQDKDTSTETDTWCANFQLQWKIDPPTAYIPHLSA